MKRFWALAIFASVVLGGAAVWMGGLNQDEGWYLYAANLVSEGQLPYRDFFYTQGPVMPCVYSAFTWVWKMWGVLGARMFTLVIGMVGIVFAVALARRMVADQDRSRVSVVVFLLLGCNLYHLYYLAIPKTYALATLFAMMGFYLIDVANGTRLRDFAVSVMSGLCLALAMGTRISLGAMLCVVGLWLLVSRRRKAFVGFALGGAVGLALLYVPFLCDETARAGIVAAQCYHAARGGFDLTWVIGSLSRLVRWYLPVFIVLGLGDFRRQRMLLFAVFAVFAVQMCAPFPYEDYQVPVMGLLAVFAAVNFVGGNCSKSVLMVLGLCFACSFGSPLLEHWSTNGQDRFWTIKKSQFELAQLRQVAKEINAIDPGGSDLLTQDLYLAIETGRKVPKGLEMGPFSMLTDDDWRQLLGSYPCEVAALSGYSFAIEPPKCGERSVERQLEYGISSEKGIGW